MTVQQARRLAAQRLVFGDPDQIRAFEVLEVYEEVVEWLGVCEGEVCQHCQKEYRNMDLAELRGH
jgi:hypothetical protein